jgi:hypothetical protein
MIAEEQFSRLTSNPDVIDQRLTARLTRWELFAITMNLAMVGVFVWLHTQGQIAYDYHDYINAVHGDFSHYYYGYWFLPVFSLLAKLPVPMGYILWCIANILCLFFAARAFGGITPAVLLSYQMFYSLYYGQINCILIGGLTLLWWGMAHRRWYLAGLGLLIACTKFQIGMTLGVFLLLLADNSFRDRLRVLIVPSIIITLSLFIYPLWPLKTLATLQSSPLNTLGNLTLWRWIGPAALLLWLPPLLLPLPRQKRLVALAATTALAIPYFQQADLLGLFILPIGWLVLLGNLGYLFYAFQWQILQALVVIPLLVYAAIIIPALREQLSSRGHSSSIPPS